MSKVFSDTYSKNVQAPVNADIVIKGGTGYAIHTINGRECFDGECNACLPEKIERCFPDYSIYQQYDFAISMTTRGCPRGCAFCHVAAKEGRKSVKVANVNDFWNGQKMIKVLDANITACKDKHELFQQYIDTHARIDFTQGLDIRLITQADVEYLNRMKIYRIHFAWDNQNDDLENRFKEFSASYRYKNKGSVYILTNFDSTIEEDLYRIYTVRDIGYDPYVMIYDKNNAPKEIRKLQRWCNNKFIFNSCRKFEDYKKG